MSWVCFYQGITGFLHWGFNFWYNDLYGLKAEARFKGDGFIVYPNAENNTVDFYVRAVNTRDGIQEYELLHMLSLKAPKTAKTLAKRIGVGFCNFNSNANCMDTARKQLLQTLNDLYND